MPRSRSVIGIDLGGTKIAAARFDAVTLELQATASAPTQAELTFDFVREEILQCISTLKAADTVAVGIGVPGPVDAKTRRILRLPNIPGADGFDLAAYVEEHTGYTAAIANDAGCFAYAEAKLGAGKGESVVVGVVMGTGVGGGIVIDGKIFNGAHGFAGEVGHMLLMPGKPPYETDDRRGEVEQFLSGTAMGRRCVQAKSPTDYLAGDACAFMQPHIFEEVAWLITDIAHVIDPSVVVFGGSAGRALRQHLPAVEAALRHWMLPGVPLPRLAVGELTEGPMRGAALLALAGR